eukprot:1558381-Amphidinium_carterae.1
MPSAQVPVRLADRACAGGVVWQVAHVSCPLAAKRWTRGDSSAQRLMNITSDLACSLLGFSTLKHRRMPIRSPRLQDLAEVATILLFILACAVINFSVAPLWVGLAEY